jgi:hypothetical protein
MNVGSEICDCLTLGNGSETDGLLSGSELTITGLILTLELFWPSNLIAVW